MMKLIYFSITLQLEKIETSKLRMKVFEGRMGGKKSKPQTKKILSRDTMQKKSTKGNNKTRNMPNVYSTIIFKEVPEIFRHKRRYVFVRNKTFSCYSIGFPCEKGGDNFKSVRS